jgi:hypothetical protein
MPGGLAGGVISPVAGAPGVAGASDGVPGPGCPGTGGGWGIVGPVPPPGVRERAPGALPAVAGAVAPGLDPDPVCAIAVLTIIKRPTPPSAKLVSECRRIVKPPRVTGSRVVCQQRQCHGHGRRR